MRRKISYRKILVFLWSLLLAVCLLVPHTTEASSYGLNKTSLNLYTGKAYRLKVSGVSGTVKWSSSNKKVAAVSSKGYVKAKKAGKATITARVGYSKFICRVTVKNPALNTKKLTMVKGKSYTLKLNGTGIKSVKTSNSSVAVIRKNGKITAKKNGTCKLTVTGTNKKTYTCTVKVETPSLSQTQVKLLTGQSVTLKLNGNTQKVTWSSGDNQVAKVSSSGQVQTTGQGAVKITAKVNTASYSCYINCVDQEGIYTRAEWMYRLMKNRGVSLQGSFNTANYHYSDTKKSPYGSYIEAAYLSGILPDETLAEDVPRFNPNATATREFAAVTVVRALGYQLNDNMKLSCTDASLLKYVQEDYMAVNKGFLKLEGNSFKPDAPVMEADKRVIYAKMEELDSSVNVIEPKDEVKYASSTVEMDSELAQSYTLTDNQDGTFLVTMPPDDQSNRIYAGKTFVLPANSQNPVPVALTATAVRRAVSGMVEITARRPTNMAQVVSSVEFAGTPTLIPGKITSLTPGIGCTYQPNGEVQNAAKSAYYMESMGEEVTGKVIGGSTPLPGKLHFDLGKGISIGKKAKLKGTFELEIPDITAKVDLDCGWSGIKINEAVVSISEKAKTTAKLEYTVAQSEMAEGVAGSKELTRVPFSLGTTGLSLDVVVSLFYDAKGKISIVYTLDATQGIQYKDGDLRNLCTFKNSLDLPNIEGSAKIGYQLGLNITAFEIWDIIGVNAQIGPGATASLKNHVTEKLICVDASLYMYAKVGLSTETILGEFLKDTWHYQLEKVVYNEHNSPLKMKLHFENSKKVETCTYGKGKITGYVYDGKTEKAISGARIRLNDSDGMVLQTVYTDGNGKYLLENLSPKTYQLEISATDYRAFTMNQKVEKNTSTYVETALMLLREETTPAMIKGNLIDGVSGYRISDVTIKVRKGWNQTSGTVVQELKASSSYNFWIEPGNYTLQASVSGYVSETVNIAAKSGGEVIKDITLVPKNTQVGKGTMRIVLTWGYTPYDLDAHLFGPTVNGNGTFHTYWYRLNKNYNYGNTNIANLDLDDRYSYGPETTTVNKVNKSGTYSFYVHDYTNRAKSSSKYLSASNAKVTVYFNGKLTATYHVPVNKGGTVWHVFDYNASKKQLTARNRMYYSSLPTTLRSGKDSEPDAAVNSQLMDICTIPDKDYEENPEEVQEVTDVPQELINSSDEAISPKEADAIESELSGQEQETDQE